MNLYSRFKALTPGSLRYYATIQSKDTYQTVMELMGGGLLKLPLPTTLDVGAKVWMNYDYTGYTLTSAPNLGTEIVIEV